MRETDPGFILFAGDSHIDMFDQPSEICGRDTANAGLSGVTTDVYATALKTLHYPHKASLAVLTIGTNDLARKKHPDPEAFQASVTSIVQTLKEHASFIVMTAIPPIGTELAGSFNIGSIEKYSTILSDICTNTGACSYQDPYQDMRVTGEFGLAKPNTLADGVHAKSYRDIYERVPLCRILAEAR
ncbi:SGNH/GDSL hydrolase family protein [Bosea sp. 685]|uniref:SGNH/GDSL hydrolase family protein n=1 Tax=Bosea sp. 685 TaxID=3080057 RepID=UPI0028936CED|nr:GDSL-type esterase/lipase family protein [Bosea sp. 685]WNJ89484.1 GDSL-type esterase/lipase family protein [Bosea sp. 685]